MNSNPLETLTGIASRIAILNSKIDSLSKRAKRREAAESKAENLFDAELKKLRAEVLGGNISLGDKVKDYILVNYPIRAYKNLSGIIGEHAHFLNLTLKKLSDSRCFWHHKKEYLQEERQEIYEVLFLGDNPYTITPSEIKLQAHSSRIVTLESVFQDEKTIWPFVKDINERRDLIVAPDESRPDYKTPRIIDANYDFNNIEMLLKNNPLALAVFRKSFGLEVPFDLQEKAGQYVYAVAFKAFSQLKKYYSEVKKNDKKIQDIEEEYNSPKKTIMFSRKPVIQGREPDSFLAAILSSDSRENRDWALESLAYCVNDLDRTGLADYSTPLETRLDPGQVEISNLAEYSNYVRGILELWYKAIKAVA